VIHRRWTDTQLDVRDDRGPESRPWLRLLGAIFAAILLLAAFLIGLGLILLGIVGIRWAINDFSS